MTYLFPTGFFTETLPTDNSPLHRLFSDDLTTDNCPVLSHSERLILTNAHSYHQAKKRAEIAANGPLMGGE